MYNLSLILKKLHLESKQKVSQISSLTHLQNLNDLVAISIRKWKYDTKC